MKKSLVVLSTAVRRPAIDRLFLGVDDVFSVSLVKLKSSELISFSRLRTLYQLDTYDCVVVDLPHKYLRHEVSGLNDFNKHIFLYEEDACQNYMPDSRWHGDFSRFYRKLTNVGVIATGSHVTQQLKAEGIPAFFLPKGFDETIIFNVDRERRVDLGFIGTYGSSTYHQRYKMLRHMELFARLNIFRTEPGGDYCRKLNKIKTFFSADCGIGEYMAKNFEAMAAGCLLLAYEQGDGEESALGLESGVNALLYKTKKQAEELARWAVENPVESSRIAAAGMEHAVSHHSYSALSKKLSAILDRPG